MRENLWTMIVVSVACLAAVSSYAAETKPESMARPTAPSSYTGELKPVICGKGEAFGSIREASRPTHPPKRFFNDDYLVDIPDGTVRPVLDGVLSSGEWSDAVQIDISDTLGEEGGVDPPGTVLMWLKHYPYTYGSETYDAIWVGVENTADHQTDPESYDQIGFYVDDNRDEQWSPCFGGDHGESIEGNFWSVRAHQDTLMFREIRWPCNPSDTSWLLVRDSVWSKVSMTGGNVTFEFIVLYGDLFYMLNVAKDFPKGLWAFCLNDTAGGGIAGIWNGWYPQVCAGMCDQENFATLDPPPVMVTLADDFQDNQGVPGTVPDNGGTIDFMVSYLNTTGSPQIVSNWVDIWTRDPATGCDKKEKKNLKLEKAPFTLDQHQTKTFIYSLGPVPDGALLKIRTYNRVGTTLWEAESELFFDDDIKEKNNLGGVPLGKETTGPSSWHTFGVMESYEVTDQ